ncbi:MAG: hypothetical protein B7Z16_10405 [Algoriphagus sp. 32-45-6]|nr:MAG: hypothetical protein B7Z16_10405 [Algoriphagus sp. 32-45-6]
MNFKINPKSTSRDYLKVIPVLSSTWKSLQENLGLSGLIPEALFSGKKDSKHILTLDNQLILLTGLGEDPETKTVENSFRRIISQHRKLAEKGLIIQFSDQFSTSLIEAALIGLQLGDYHLGFYKKEQPESLKKLKIELIFEGKGLKNAVDRAEKIAAAKMEAFRLVDLPPNKITPENLATWAKNAGKTYGFEVKVWDVKKAKSEGLEAFLAVGRGSAKEPRFIIMEYRGPKAKSHFGLVGKGVTFDTGGLNIKTQAMHHRSRAIPRRWNCNEVKYSPSCPKLVSILLPQDFPRVSLHRR